MLGTTAARERARELLAEFKVQSAPVPIERIVRGVGAVIEFGPLDGELSGMAFIKDGRPIIGVNALHAPNRQRFTIAHELGHILLHRPLLEQGVHVDRGILRRDTLASEGSDPNEMEANAFAAEILMPTSLLNAALEGRYVDLEDEAAIEPLARKFRVSVNAFQFQLQRL